MHFFIDFWKLETENSLLHVFSFYHKLNFENSFCFLPILSCQISLSILKIENCFWKQKIRKKNSYQTYPKFSLHFEEKTFWWTQWENIWTPPFIFLPSHPTKHILKKISFLFSLHSFPFTIFHLQTKTPLMPLSVKAISCCPLLLAIDPSSRLQSNNGMPFPKTSKGCFQSENNFCCLIIALFNWCTIFILFSILKT